MTTTTPPTFSYEQAAYRQMTDFLTASGCEAGAAQVFVRIVLLAMDGTLSWAKHGIAEEKLWQSLYGTLSALTESAAEARKNANETGLLQQGRK